MPWRDYLVERLRTLQPDSVCTLDAAAHRLVATLPFAAHAYAADAPAAPACTLALGVDALAGLDTREAEQLIGRVRTYAAPRLLLVAQPGCALDATAFRALGFMLALCDPAAGVRVHEYDLDTYKTVPDWLNARFWAHPERWDA